MFDLVSTSNTATSTLQVVTVRWLLQNYWYLPNQT
jgi:hypothetical protein